MNRTILSRWATLGYHHNWDTKQYSEDSRTEFPVELALLSSEVAMTLGWTKFKAEAAIVNYYPTSSTLNPHTDHSERNLSAPLVSISLGLSAIFLIGGSTLAEKPTALLLNRLEICQNIYTTQFSGKNILHSENS